MMSSYSASAGGELSASIGGLTLAALLGEWEQELKRQEEEFGKKAEEVAEWDKVVRKQYERIAHLRYGVMDITAEQAALEAQLEAIKNNQDTMEGMLVQLETSMDERLRYLKKEDAAGMGSVFGVAVDDVMKADENRMHAMATAEAVRKQLDDLEESLETIRARMQEESRALQDDPLEQIRAILDSQMTALSSLHAESGKLSADAGRLSDQLKKLQA